MKIDELIHALNEVKSMHGNVEVKIRNIESGIKSATSINEVSTATVPNPQSPHHYFFIPLLTT